MLIYFDNNASTPIDPEVISAIDEVMRVVGNPSSQHSAGSFADKYLQLSRRQIARFIGASPDEIIFTSGGTESNNIISHMFYGASIGSAIEHKSMSTTWQVPVNLYGRVILYDLKKMLDTHPVQLVSIILANNETGIIQDLGAIANLVHKYAGVYLHTDASQALGKMPVAVRYVDYMTLSAHKMHGPKGVGALYVRRGVPIIPLFSGGYQENERRPGTENLLGIVGFGKAVDICDLREMDQVKLMRDRLVSDCHDEGYIINSNLDVTLPNTLNISIPHVSNTLLSSYLETEGICISTGSACNTGSIMPSHVIQAIGGIPETAIRISLSKYNTMEEVELFLGALKFNVARIRSVSNDLP